MSYKYKYPGGTISLIEKAFIRTLPPHAPEYQWVEQSVDADPEVVSLIYKIEDDMGLTLDFRGGRYRPRSLLTARPRLLTVNWSAWLTG